MFCPRVCRASAETSGSEDRRKIRAVRMNGRPQIGRSGPESGAAVPSPPPSPAWLEAEIGRRPGEMHAGGRWCGPPVPGYCTADGGIQAPEAVQGSPWENRGQIAPAPHKPSPCLLPRQLPQYNDPRLATSAAGGFHIVLTGEATVPT